jgi:hypothetical protein
LLTYILPIAACSRHDGHFDSKAGKLPYTVASRV